MIKTKSNLSSNLYLTAMIVSSGPPGESEPWSISLTSPGFPDKKLMTLFQSKDQQLIDFEELIQDLIQERIEDKESKLEFASFLERMAESIRSNI